MADHSNQSVIIDGTIVNSGTFISKSVFDKNPKFELVFPETFDIFTAMIVDKDVKKNFIHLLIMNVDPGKTLKVIVPFMAPSPPTGEVHKYHVLIYKQSGIISDIRKIKKRHPFNLKSFIRKYNLKSVKTTYFSSGRTEDDKSKDEKILAISDLSSSANSSTGVPKKDYFIKGTPLSEHEQSYCRCTLHVGHSSIGRTGYTSRSPYAICNKNFHLGRVECGKWYNWDKLPDTDLQGYAFTHGIEIPEPFSRKKLIKKIMKTK